MSPLRSGDGRAKDFLSVTLTVPTTSHHLAIVGRSIMSFHPQTPQSPSQFSPGTSDQNMSMSSSMTSITTALPTPAHSVNGSTLPTDASQDVVMGGDSPHKRKRAFDDLGDRQQKKVHSEGRKLGIDDLHLDVGEKYLLCRTRKAPLKLSDECGGFLVTTAFCSKTWLTRALSSPSYAAPACVGRSL